MDKASTESKQSIPSLVRGGPFEALMRRLGLAKVGRRAVVLALVAWLPLVLIAGVHAFLTPDRETLLDEISLHVRFLVALPILVIATLPVERRWEGVVEHIPSSGLLDKTQMPRFDLLLAQTGRNAGSWFIELLLLVLAYLTVLVFSEGPGSVSVGLFVRAVPDKQVLSSGVWWYSLVSQPLYVFLLYRWLWRWLVWSIFLWHLARFPLRLSAAHPDRAGGLLFLSVMTEAFWLVIFAASLTISSNWLAVILAGKADISSFYAPFLALLALVLLVFLGPFFFFTGALRRYRHQGFLEYSALLNHYTSRFERKWIPSPEKMPTEEFLGTADFSALADLGTSFTPVKEMKTVPVNREKVVMLVFAVLLPMLPLFLTVLPLKEILWVVLEHMV